MQPNRVVVLDGGRNFRDLGGYVTADGQRIRWGRLYRSGVMAHFTDDDHARLAALNIRVLFDLRTERERQREPTQWRDPSVTRLHWDYDPTHTSLRSYMGSTTQLTPQLTFDCMLQLYRALPALFETQYAALFRQLSDDVLPLVFHCSAGKDRTGLAAALVLTSLGVPEPVIMADYALTETVVDLEKTLFSQPRSSLGIGDEYAHLSRVDRETRAPLLRAHPDYLRAAFAQINEDHGSVADYLRGRLGVSSDAMQRIRANLLQA